MIKGLFSFLTMLVWLLALPTAGQASSIQELGKPAASGSIQTIGVVPVKKQIVLELGELRTKEAKLPQPRLTLAERNLKRSRMALARQEAVTNASRDRLKRMYGRQNDEDDEDEDDGPPEFDGESDEDFDSDAEPEMQ